MITGAITAPGRTDFGEHTMIDRFGDWEVVSRKTNSPISHFFLILLQIPVASGAGPIAGFHSSVTWTLRNLSTGETRCITAESESEVAERVEAGKFDRTPRWRRGRTVPLIAKPD
jgi:hypothetical protein